MDRMKTNERRSKNGARSDVTKRREWSEKISIEYFYGLRDGWGHNIISLVRVKKRLLIQGCDVLWRRVGYIRIRPLLALLERDVAVAVRLCRDNEADIRCCRAIQMPRIVKARGAGKNLRRY